MDRGKNLLFNFGKVRWLYAPPSSEYSSIFKPPPPLPNMMLEGQLVVVIDPPESGHVMCRPLLKPLVVYKVNESLLQKPQKIALSILEETNVYGRASVVEMSLGLASSHIGLFRYINNASPLSLKNISPEIMTHTMRISALNTTSGFHNPQNLGLQIWDQFSKYLKCNTLTSKLLHSLGQDALHSLVTYANDTILCESEHPVRVGSIALLPANIQECIRILNETLNEYDDAESNEEELIVQYNIMLLGVRSAVQALGTGNIRCRYYMDLKSMLDDLVENYGTYFNFAL